MKAYPKGAGDDMTPYEIWKESIDRATYRYIRECQKIMSLDWEKDEWEKEIEPQIKERGYTISAFIKEAVKEKLENGKDSIACNKPLSWIKISKEEANAPCDKYKCPNCDAYALLYPTNFCPQCGQALKKIN